VTTIVVQPEPEPEPQPEPEPEPAPEPEPEPEPEEDNSGSGSLGTYETAILDQHNIHRRNHSAPDLAWDATLAQYASNTANSCVFEHDMDQGSGGYGQNLATWGSSGDISSKQIETAEAGVTMQWYNNEAENWSYYGLDNPPEGSDLHAWGHFTQLVWKSSTKVGCATVKCPADTIFDFESWYTVCNYNPPGNFGGEYGKNVLQPGNARMIVI
jgi:uncharacterized protein YkwD